MNRKHNCRLCDINARFILIISLNNSGVSTVTDAFVQHRPRDIVNYVALITVVICRSLKLLATQAGGH